MEYYKHQYFIFVTLLLSVYSISCRTTVDQVIKPDDEKATAKEPIRLHVITKREAMNDIEQVYPRVNGRTFRASDPLNPNTPTSADQAAPQNLFDSFDTVNEIFQPQVNDDHSESVNNNNDDEHEEAERATEAAALSATETGTDDSQTDDISDSNVQNDVMNARQTSQSVYSQGSYFPTDGRSNSRTQYETPGSGYLTNNLGTQQRVDSRRVVLAGRGPDTDSNNQRTPYYRGSPRPRGYPTQTTEVRGPYYSGRRYVDSNGHYVDAQGRHLDSTGRYYDVSGRYTDATMTRTVFSQGASGGANFIHSANTRPGYDSGTGSSYYDNTRGYGSRGGRLDSTGRYVESGGSQIDQTGSRPVNSYGGTQFYSSGNSYQTTYNPVTSQISSDTTCAGTNDRITVHINDLECQQAVSRIGRFVCYNYERVSRDCCQTCLQVKDTQHDGCEYGDRSAQCETIQPSDCYNERNRQVCCNRCRHYREQTQHLNLPATCSYGDRTQQCQNVAQRHHLCYLPENQRVCCATCPRNANQNQPGCQWGNQSPEFCEPFDAQGRVRLNCYRHEVRDICCSTCRSLRDRLRETIPGCEYGDYPIMFYIGQRQLTCSEYIRQFGIASCDEASLARQCCHTCHRYRQVRG